MTRVLAIDPGNTESAYVLLDETTMRPLDFGKVSNEGMRDVLYAAPGYRAAIEMVASYGMAVGAEVFETCLWTGRFYELLRIVRGFEPELVYRRDIKLHHCGSAKAKDANITQALIDRFASGQPNRGKGTKKNPGWFYGFRADVWQAYALGVYVADKLAGKVAA